ncbi:MAG: ATP-dependent helicase, partial [Propionibacteriaceae bacterium]|nr:ATP-dependent helicase [Propionibacteriaceae bacterium]
MSNPAQLREILGIRYSEEQLAAIGAPLAPGVVIAGAGSGKTAVMAARAVWLAASGQVPPGKLLGLTFTRKAAGELAGRVRAALERAGVANPADGEEPLVTTYDAFAKQLVEDYGFFAGVESGAKLLTAGAAYRVAAEVVEGWPGDLEHSSQYSPMWLTGEVRSLAHQLRSHLATAAQVRELSERFLRQLEAAPQYRGKPYKDVEAAIEATWRRLELLPLVERYEELKSARGYVEFADLMAQAAGLAAVPGVGRALRGEFAAVMLDEYQDTSAAQAALLSGLFSGPDSEAGRGHPVTAVGDPGQAIYGWRGAAAANILEFPRVFPNADGSPAATYPLTINRRSGRAVLDAANAVSEKARAQVPVESPEALRLRPDAENGEGQIEVLGFETDLEEMAFIGERASALVVSGQVQSWAKIAVLTRTNAASARIYQELGRQGVPAEIVGLGGLLQLPAAQDVLATLRLLADPTENPSLVRLLTSPRWAIGKHDLAHLGWLAKMLARPPQEDVDGSAPPKSEPQSLLEAMSHPEGFPPETARRFRRFTAELSHLREFASGSLVDLAQAVAQALGADAEYFALGADPRLSGIPELLQAVADYEDFDRQASLSGLLAYLDAVGSDGVGLEQPAVSNSDAVKLITIHKAKGLEFDAV